MPSTLGGPVTRRRPPLLKHLLLFHPISARKQTANSKQQTANTVSFTVQTLNPLSGRTWSRTWLSCRSRRPSRRRTAWLGADPRQPPPLPRACWPAPVLPILRGASPNLARRRPPPTVFSPSLFSQSGAAAGQHPRVVLRGCYAAPANAAARAQVPRRLFTSRLQCAAGRRCRGARSDAVLLPGTWTRRCRRWPSAALRSRSRRCPIPCGAPCCFTRWVDG